KTPVISAIKAVSADGTPADGSKASAEVGQIIEIDGSNFTIYTRVNFPTRDNNGQSGTVTVAPNVVRKDGTRMQVSVPDLATSGNVTLNTVNNPVNLGFSGYGDTIYRGITLSFTAGSGTEQVRFADGGLQGVGDESWGIDNVGVAAAATPG